MKIHDETSAQAFEKAAADALAAVQEARAAVREAKRSDLPKISANVFQRAASMFKPKEPEKPEPVDPTNPFPVIAGQMRLIPGMKVDQSSNPAGVDSVIPNGPTYDARQEGNRDEPSIIGPAIEAAHKARRELVEKELERRRPEQERIEAVKQKMAEDAANYWRGQPPVKSH